MSKRQVYSLQLRKPRDPQEARRRRVGTPTETPLPFRWDISHRERLGSFIKDNANDTLNTYQTTYPGFLEALLACAARTVALAGNADIVIVGRSPESLFDLLSGLFHGTIWSERLTLLRYSRGHSETSEKRRKQPEVLAAFRAYMDALGLSPARLIVREHPVALTDLICNGTTMQQLLLLIQEWAIEEKYDWSSVRRKLRVVALIRRDDKPPVPLWRRRRDGSTKPWCWRQYAEWVDELLERGRCVRLPCPPNYGVFWGMFR